MASGAAKNKLDYASVILVDHTVQIDET